MLCEKPISNDIRLGQEMVDTAKRLDRCLGVDLNHRFTPAARAAKQWQEEGKIGELLFCNMSLWIGKFMKLDSPYYHLKALNPHSVDIMRYFCGDVEEVFCYAMKASGRDIWSTASINMKFACGAVGHLTSSYDIVRGHPWERCEVAGVKGRLVFEDMWRRPPFTRGQLDKGAVYQPGVRGIPGVFRYLCRPHQILCRPGGQRLPARGYRRQRRGGPGGQPGNSRGHPLAGYPSPGKGAGHSVLSRRCRIPRAASKEGPG